MLAGIPDEELLCLDDGTPLPAELTELRSLLQLHSAFAGDDAPPEAPSPYKKRDDFQLEIVDGYDAAKGRHAVAVDGDEAGRVRRERRLLHGAGLDLVEELRRRPALGLGGAGARREAAAVAALAGSQPFVTFGVPPSAESAVWGAARSGALAARRPTPPQHGACVRSG